MYMMEDSSDTNLRSETNFDPLLPYLLSDSDVVKSLLTDGYAVLPGILTDLECNDALDKIWDFISTVGYGVSRDKPRSWYPKPHATWGKHENSIEDPWPQTHDSFPDMIQNCGAGWLLGEIREKLAQRVFEKHIFGTDQLLCSKEGFTACRPLMINISEESQVKSRRNNSSGGGRGKDDGEKLDSRSKHVTLLHPKAHDKCFYVGSSQQTYLVKNDNDKSIRSRGICHIQSSVSFLDQDEDGKDGCFVCWPGSHNTIHESIFGHNLKGKNSKCYASRTDEEIQQMENEFGLTRKIVPVRKGDVIIWRNDLIHTTIRTMIDENDFGSSILHSFNFRMVSYCSMIPVSALQPSTTSDIINQRKIESYLYSRTGDHRPNEESWHPDWGEGKQEEIKSLNGSKVRVRLIKTFFQLKGGPPKLTWRQAQLYGIVPYDVKNDEKDKIIKRLEQIGVKFTRETSSYASDLGGRIHPSLVELRHHSGEDMLGQDKWLGGMPSPCERYVYGVPGTHPRVLRITCATGEVDYIGPTFNGPFKWLRGIEVPPSVMGESDYPSGCCIALPCNALSVLRIDPHTSEVITFGELEGNWMYHGGSLAVDGMIYAIPANAEQVLKIDPRTTETWLIGPKFKGQQKWYGGLLASNGAIYGIPQNASGMIKIVPETQEVSIVGEGLLPDGEWKWHGGLTTSDGRFIYGFANNADTVLKLDTATDTITLIGGPDVLKSGRHRVPQDNKYKYLGGAIAPNGKIFLFPCDAERVLMIDPETDEVSCVGPYLLEGENKYQNGFCAKDGSCYAIPQRARGVLKITCQGDDVIVEQLDCGDVMAKYKEKFEGGVMCDGEIYCIPMRAKSAIKIIPNPIKV